MLTQTIPPELEARVQQAIRALDDARQEREDEPDNPLVAVALDAAISEALNARAALSEWTDD